MLKMEPGDICHGCDHRQRPPIDGRCACGADPQRRAIHELIALKVCPLDKFGGPRPEATKDRKPRIPPPDVEILARRGRWHAVRKSWDDAIAFAKSMASRGLNDHKIDPQTRALRVLSCHGDPAQNVRPCPSRAYSIDGKFHFCNDCGCGQRELARLSAVGSSPSDPQFRHEEYDKLDYPYLECPRQRPGFSNAAPGSAPP